MQIHEHLGHAGLAGWRKTVADVVAPRVPIADDQARMIIGLGFFALSVYYVIATIVKATKRAD
jgi:Na+(H+)/acetate symporter ActP